MDVTYTYETGRHGVDYLHAPYALLVQAFGNDGISLRDTYKSMCQWTDDAVGYEVYDYKTGTCYWSKADGGLEREEITVWHVQATEAGKNYLTGMLDKAVLVLNAQAPAELPVGESEYLEVVDEAAEHAEALELEYRKANAEGVEQEFRNRYAAALDTVVTDELKVNQYVANLLNSDTVRIGAEDEDGFWIDGGVEIDMARDLVRVGLGTGEQLEEIQALLSLEEIREAHALLEAYLRVHDSLA